MLSRKNTVDQVLAAASNRPLSDEELSARWGKDHKNRQSHIDYVRREVDKATRHDDLFKQQQEIIAKQKEAIAEIMRSSNERHKNY